MVSKQRLMELRTMPYKDYLKTPEWQAKREEVLARDGYRCCLCNCGANLQVHHRTYVRKGDEMLSDLLTLCKEDHEHFHKRVRMTDDMMTERKDAYEQATKREDAFRNWESYLIGMLIQNPMLYQHVCGIFSEGEFQEEEFLMLYRLVQVVVDTGQSFEQLVPRDLQDTVNESLERAGSSAIRGDLPMIKETIKVVIRLKRMFLLRETSLIQVHIKQVGEDGDREALKRLIQEAALVHRKIRTLDLVAHIQN